MEERHVYRLNRLEALTDGIFAIVMTILVLDIKLPHDINLFKKVNLEQFLTGYFQDVIVYMIVFITLACIWFIHHTHTHLIQHTDRNHLWINIILLMFVALVPFSSSLVNKFPMEWLAGAVLSVNMFIVGLLAYASWAYAAKDKRLLDGGVTASYIAMEKRRLLLFPVISSLSLIFAFIYPHLCYYIFLLAPFLFFSKKLFRKGSLF
jgi:uncharacterized membrane protein